MMGSIPLPALDLKTPQQPDLLSKYGQLMQLKNMQQQSQMQQQEAPLRLQALQQGVQTGGLQLQQAQQQQKDDQTFRAATQDPSLQGKTYGQIADYLASKGQISPQGLATAKKADLEHQEAVQKLDTAKLTNIKAAHDQTQQIYNNVMDMPDDQLAANWPQIAQQVNSIPGNEKMPLNPQQPMTKQQLGQFGPMLGMANSYLDQELARRQKQAELTAEQAKPQQAAATAAETARHNVVDEGNARQRISIEGARLNFEKQRQGTQDGSAIEAQAQQIANGDVKGLSQARQNPFARAVMSRVYEINPKYSDSLYTATQDLRSSKPNSMGGNVGRLGTAILHADEALSHSKDLGFSEGLLTGVGTSGTAAYKQAAEFLTGEIGQYVTGGKLTVDEGKKLSSDLMSSRQGVRDSALHEIITLSKGKLQSQMGQFKNATQTDFPTDRVFSDSAISSALHKHGVIDTPSNDPFAQFGGKAH
jgi:polyhydroxyalkanoate synthesis regulator phasin